MYNYELKAPGTSVISTFSNGGYKVLNGTSMACPLVAGAVSRLLQTKEYPTKELLFGDLIHAANGGNVDMLATYDITDEDRKPNLSLVSWRIEDEKDNDGRFDAGESIKFYPVIRNDWGTAENIQVWMEMGDQESHSVLSFSQAMVSFAKPLSSYAKAEMENPIEFKMADDVVDGHHIRLVLYALCDGMDEPTAQEITITAENGVEIGGMIDNDMTLSAGINYIVNRSLAVADGATLTIEPGTVIKFADGAGISTATDGKLIAIGTPERPITFTKRDLDASLPNIKFSDGYKLKYIKFNNLYLRNTLNGAKIEDCEFCNNGLESIAYLSTIVRSVFSENQCKYSPFYDSSSIDNTSINNSVAVSGLYNNYASSLKLKGNNAFSNFYLYNNKILLNYSTENNGGGRVGVTKFDYPLYWGGLQKKRLRDWVLRILRPIMA